MKKLSSLIGFLLMSLAVMAAPVDQEAAQAKARAFLTAKAPSRAGLRLAPARKSLSAAAADGYFVFNIGTQDGFVLVSGDDRTPAILGYVDHGTFSEEQLPASVKAWLASYSDQLAWLQTHPQQALAPRLVTVKRAISPLIQTNWDQDEPYNKLVPNFVTGEPSLTGCVATAMAQVMKFHEWPAKTTAEIPAYQCKSNYTGYGRVSVPAVPAGTQLDWVNMQPIYTGNESAEQQTAVARLMQACGASVNMDYASATQGGSSASASSVAGALKTYFDYSASTSYVQRRNYSIDAWNELVYGELRAGCPVFTGGQSSGGGHAFVIDGYSSDDLFHINWGWSGYCDGYYLLSVLNPGSSAGSGASSSSDGYSFDQDAVIGIRPNDGSAVEDKLSPMECHIVDVSGNSVSCSYYSRLEGENTFHYGIGYVQADGSFKEISYRTSAALEKNYGYKSASFAVTGLDDGTYKVVPICRPVGTTKWFCDINFEENYVEAVVSNGAVTLTWKTPAIALRIKGVSLNTTPVRNSPLSLLAEIENQGDEFYGPLYLFASTTTSKGTAAAKVGVTIRKGETQTVPFNFTPKSSGSYNLWFALDDAGSQLLASAKITVVANGSTEPFAVESLSWDNLSGSEVYGFLSGSVVVKNNSTETFDGGVRITLYQSPTMGNGVSFSSCASADVYGVIPAGETRALHFEIDNQTLDNYFWPIIQSLTTGSTLRQNQGDIVRLRPGVVQYMADGTKTAQRATSTVSVDERAQAVVLTGISGVNTLTGGSPNTLYYFGANDAVPSSLKGNIIRGGEAENIVLEDGSGFHAPMGFTAKNISFTRSFTPALNDKGQGWESIILPFDVNVVEVAGQPADWFRAKGETGKDFYLMEFTDERGQNVVFAPAARMEAAVPYLIGFSAAGAEGARTVTFKGQDAFIPADIEAVLTGGSYKMIGVLQAQVVEKALTLNAEGTAFVQADGKTDAFRAYFVPTASAPEGYTRADIDVDALFTSLSEVQAESQEGEWFTLSGQRTSQPTQKGVYVRSGRKVLVK